MFDFYFSIDYNKYSKFYIGDFKLSETISININKKNECFIENYFKNPTLDIFKFCNLSISQRAKAYNNYIPNLEVSNKKELNEKLEQSILFISDKNYENYFENCILLYNSSILFKNWFIFYIIDLVDIASLRTKNVSEENSVVIKLQLDIKLKNNTCYEFILFIPRFIIINEEEYKLNFDITLLTQHINSLLFKHVSNYNKNIEYKNNL